jgi:hypothetical protein
LRETGGDLVVTSLREAVAAIASLARNTGLPAAVPPVAAQALPAAE